MADQYQCPDCGGEMEQGFIPDASYMSVWQTCWHRGAPEGKTFLGVDAKSLGINYDADKMLPVTACRCTGCGLLKFHAKPSAKT